MKILFIGDIVGDAGRKAVRACVMRLRAQHGIDIVIANNENMAGGFGITPETFLEICQAGVDVQTGGNHTFDKKEGLPVLSSEDSVLRPANYPTSNPGRGSGVYTTSKGIKVGVLNVMGRIFMDPLDCPFQVAEKHIQELEKKTKIIFVDFHGEASSEKMAFAWNFDGRVSAVIGTHTHVQTADERILPQGTAFLTDAGMTGPYDSVIGVKKEVIIEKFLTRKGKRYEVASGEPWLCGAIIEVDTETGKAQSIERINIRRPMDL
jgi:metallophosphoesterase (TIGR00282 family)